MNIFTQPSEPETKDGIWIKTDEKYDYENVIFTYDINSQISDFIFSYGNTLDTNLYINGACILNYNIYEHCVNTKGQDVISKYGYEFYKYNLLTNTYTKLSIINSMLSTFTNILIPIENYIYMFVSDDYLLRYNILEDTYTFLKASPEYYVFGETIVVTDNEYIYIIKSGYKNYKYNISENTYTSLARNINSYSMSVGSIVGDYIYCFKCDRGYSFAQKYNVNTNTWEEIQEFPIQDLYSDSYSSISIDKYIYIFCAYTDDEDSIQTACYIYNTETNTYEPLTFNATIPYAYIFSQCAGKDNNYIYFYYRSTPIGQLLNLYKYNTDEIIQNKTVIIEINPSVTQALLNENFVINFSNVKIYDNDTLQDYPCYYGNGNKWVLVE